MKYVVALGVGFLAGYTVFVAGAINEYRQNGDLRELEAAISSHVNKRGTSSVDRFLAAYSR